MGKKMMLAGCCAVSLLLSAGCQHTSGKTEETPKAAETQKATETPKAAAAQKATGTPAVPKAAGTTEIPASDPTDVPVQIQEEAAAGVPEESQPEPDTDPGTAEDLTAPQAERVYEEDMMQCPYCAQWFSTLPDDGLWNPYDRHMLEERDNNPENAQEAEEMVQCPDCGNWYEAGNIFRNHICEGQ